jgi:hypothetical protein
MLISPGSSSGFNKKKPSSAPPARATQPMASQKFVVPDPAGAFALREYSQSPTTTKMRETATRIRRIGDIT